MDLLDDGLGRSPGARTCVHVILELRRWCWHSSGARLAVEDTVLHRVSPKLTHPTALAPSGTCQGCPFPPPYPPHGPCSLPGLLGECLLQPSALPRAGSLPLSSLRLTLSSCLGPHTQTVHCSLSTSVFRRAALFRPVLSPQPPGMCLAREVQVWHEGHEEHMASHGCP